MKAPALRFPDPVREDLEAHRSGLAEETERMMRELAQPCIKITSERVSDRPLRRNPLVSLFGGRAAEPVLGVAESKFGGMPYCDPDESWDDAHYL